MSSVILNYKTYCELTQSLKAPSEFCSVSFKGISQNPLSSSDEVVFSVREDSKGNLAWVLDSEIFVEPENGIKKYCSLTNLVIDKVNNDVAFNEFYHKYWNLKTGEFYTSVTTIIGKHKKPFDVNYFSEYKAIEEIYKDNSSYKYMRKKLTTNELVDSFKKTLGVIAKLEVLELANSIKAKWALKNFNACLKGTNEHKKRELEVLSKDFFYVNGIAYKVSTDYQDFGNEKVNTAYPEFLVYNHKFKVAGQLDLLLVNKNTKNFDVYDYKTNESITYSNKFESFLAPLNNLENCKFIEYSLQLSMYAVLLEKISTYEKNILSLIHIKDIEGNTKDDFINCLDLSKACKYMLNKNLELYSLDKKEKEFIHKEAEKATSELFPD